jgi:hypothetical protein
MAVVDFGVVTAQDLDTGFIERTASDLTYALRIDVTDTGAANWTLYTHAGTPDFISYSGSKPCADLQWRLNGAGVYTAYSTIDEAVASGSGNGTLDLDFRLLTDWADRPDSYSLNIVFTIVEN